MFNRKTRQVIVYQVRAPSFLRIWDAGEAKLKVLPWEDFRIRVYLCSEGRNSYTSLELFWSQKRNNEKIRDVIKIYDQGDPKEADELLMLWEYIRQYMEEGGPPIPSGEKLGPDASEPNPFPHKVIRKAGGEAYRPEEVRAMAADKME